MSLLSILTDFIYAVICMVLICSFTKGSSKLYGDVQVYRLQLLAMSCLRAASFKALLQDQKIC